ncbi:hypothetical protein [Streptosporangium sp. NPDC006930]|uniref:hypothetical protein n=1 Tax=Streptosporangium sp. NPDC006930 TaxID=3154783 RepID=UPI003436BAC8
MGVMKPVGGPGILPGSHAVAVDAISESTGRIMAARVMLPDALPLLPGTPYELVGPAVANAVWQEEKSKIIWTIYAQGLIPLAEEETQTKAAAVQPSADATSTARIVNDRMLPQDEEWVRANLISLTSQLRRAQKTRDTEVVAQLLAKIDNLLSVGNRATLLVLPRFRRTREELMEFKRWLSAHRASQAKVPQTTTRKTPTDQGMIASTESSTKRPRTIQFRQASHHEQQWEIRDQMYNLLSQMRSAKKRKNTVLMTDLIVRAKNLMTAAPTQKFKSERKQIASYEKWLETYPALNERTIRPATAVPPFTNTNSQMASHANVKQRLRTIIDQLQEAQLSEKSDGAQPLLYEATRILAKSPKSSFPHERKQIADSARWLTTRLAALREASPPAPKKSRTALFVDESPTPKSVKQKPGRLEREPFTPAKKLALVNDVRRLLIGVAQDQSTIGWEHVTDQVAGSIFINRTEWVTVLVTMDLWAADVLPMLSALITLPDGSVDPAFRRVLKGLGFQVPQTDRALHLVWEREVERAHARYAKPSRVMPPRLVPRQS